MKQRFTRIQANQKRLLPILLALLLLVTAALWYFFRKSAPPEEIAPPPTFDVSIDGSATEGNISEGKEDIQDELDRQVKDGMINISMNMRPVFESADSAGNLLIVNDAANKHMQVIEIYRDDTGELIYRSGGIPVGSKIESDKLSTPLEKGTYPCTAYFNAVDEETGALLGKAGAKIDVTVQN